ncbi:hypothetical protein [Curtobacterium sp. TXMA1]|uniref:glycan biosynthesis hexose transferase WsfD n=1 Tax=Curtobacterium sp. TXMA1 TaxID=2876939 RepID=UPI001CCE645C|nr:hypothetical protein [Curtobacterium sp. TXMA1]UBQ02732.1 hypothetical protein LCG91_00745 [Curtobacterium sp. TXMA1]
MVDAAPTAPTPTAPTAIAAGSAAAGPAAPSTTTPAAPTRGSRRAASAWLLLVWRWVAPGGPAEDPRSRWATAVVAGCLTVAVLLLHLFVPTVVGMGDQGDGQRLMCAFGVANAAPYDYTASTQYVFTQWVPHRWAGEACGAGGSGEPYVSSQMLLVWPAVVLTPLFGWGDGIDTRAVGIVCVLLLGVLIALFVAFLPGRPLFRLIAAALVVAVVGDGVFARFFVSPYSEAACFLGVLAMVVSLLAMWRRGDPTWWGMLLFALATAFTITAKTQMVALLPAAALALLWSPLRSRSQRAPRPRGRVVPRLVGGSLVVVLAAVAVGYAAVQPRHFALLNTYNAVFVEMLPHSPDPEGDLRWFGLPADWASSSGTTVASENAAVHRPDFPRFTEEVSQGRIALFYVTHPARLVGMADRGLEAMTQPVLGYVGAYPPDVGAEPWQQEHRFPFVVVLSALLGTVPFAIVLLQIVALALGLGLAFRRRQLGDRAAAFGATVVVTTVATWAQFWAVMLSEGASEIYKHLLVTDLLNMLLLVSIPLSAALLARRIATPRSGSARGARRRTAPVRRATHLEPQGAVRRSAHRAPRRLDRPRPTASGGTR